MILIIDNYDSFTYNLVQILGELGASVQVARDDKITIEQIEALAPDQIVISPGPGNPDGAGISLDLVRHFHQQIPILGVCLGHQVIGQAFGGKIVRNYRLMHGKTSDIQHNSRGVFADVPTPFSAMRYHSLTVDEPIPEALAISARTPEGELMGLSHKAYPVFGVQFHPESILTEHGHKILQNFLEMPHGKQTTVPAEKVSRVPIEPAPLPEAILHTPIQAFINKTLSGQDLTGQEAEAAMLQIMKGKVTSAQVAGYLIALRMKGESVAEIAGSARAMRRQALPVRPQRDDIIVDTCGTGGDGAGTFNISTTAAFVVAGTGQPVAKHGNRSISSNCGSADVLEALGVSLELTPQQVADCIDEIGIGFLFAPKLHPAMKYAIGPRRELGVRTIFNILGPLTNPAGAHSQVIGVYDPDLTEPLANVLASLGSHGAYVVHGHSGLDELSTTGPNRVSVLRGGQVETITLDPTGLGFELARAEDLAGGSVVENAKICRGILSGVDGGPRRDVVIFNAAAALVAAGKADTLLSGIAMGQESIDSGAALAALDKLVEVTQAVTGAE
jgi:anthranilate synthase/phosphoribosyltransferase